MKGALLAAALCAAGALLTVAVPAADPDGELARRLLGPHASVESLPVAGPPAFRAGDRAVLFFEAAGMEGPVRGVVVVAGDRIAEVRLLRAREGRRHTAFAGDRFVDRFRDRRAAPPVAVEALTGATVSSQAVLDAVNDRLRRWAVIRAR